MSSKYFPVVNDAGQLVPRALDELGELVTQRDELNAPILGGFQQSDNGVVLIPAGPCAFDALVTGQQGAGVNAYSIAQIYDPNPPGGWQLVPGGIVTPAGTYNAEEIGGNTKVQNGALGYGTQVRAWPSIARPGWFEFAFNEAVFWVQPTSLTAQTITIAGVATPLQAYPCIGGKSLNTTPFSVGGSGAWQLGSANGWYVPAAFSYTNYTSELGAQLYVPAIDRAYACVQVGVDSNGLPVWFGVAAGPAAVNQTGYWDLGFQTLPGSKTIVPGGVGNVYPPVQIGDTSYPSTYPQSLLQFFAGGIVFLVKEDSSGDLNEVTLSTVNLVEPGQTAHTVGLYLSAEKEGINWALGKTAYAVNDSANFLGGGPKIGQNLTFTTADGKTVSFVGGILVQYSAGTGSGSGSGSGTGGGGCPSDQILCILDNGSGCAGKCVKRVRHLTISGSTCANLNGTYALTNSSGGVGWQSANLTCGDSWLFAWDGATSAWHIYLEPNNSLASIVVAGAGCDNLSGSGTYTGSIGASSCCPNGTVSFNWTLGD